MPYTQFNAKDLRREFGIRFKAQNLFDKQKIQSIEPSDWLKEAFRRAEIIGFYNEKGRSELLVSPVLSELNTINEGNFTIYSGMGLNIDEAKGLNGECDFMLSFSSVRDFVEAPIFAITEAKKQDIESGTIQCAAQLIGAKLLNEQDKIVSPPILYGCSTTGIEWRFLKYHIVTNEMIIDIRRYSIFQPTVLLGVLQAIVEETRKGITIA